MNTTIPIAHRTIPVARPYLGVDEEQRVAEVLRSGWLSQGSHVAEFERAFAEFVGAEHAVAVSSCTTALHLALLALDIHTGHEVICPSLSFIATANSIVHAGATPVFVDIDPETYNLDPGKIERAITSRTRAIMAVHQVGLPAPLTEIIALAQGYGLPVLEDAACAIGARYYGRRIGAPHGNLACFSFHPRKILTTGEGGMITTSDREIAARLRRLRQHAMSISDVVRHSARGVVFETYDEVGYNYRMTDLQGALGLAQLGRLDKFLARRRYLAARYTAILGDFDWVVCPREPEGLQHNFQSYMIRIRAGSPVGRDELMEALLIRGVSTRRGVMAIHHELPYRHCGAVRPLPETDAAAESTVVLPLFHEMTEEDQDYVVDCIREISMAS